jgi:hypothetical protein
MKLVEKLKEIFNKKKNESKFPKNMPILRISNKPKPIFTIYPFLYRDEKSKETYLIPGKYNLKTMEIQIPIKEIYGEKTFLFTFKPEEWEEAKELFDEKSKKEIEKFIKIVMKRRVG